MGIELGYMSSFIMHKGLFTNGFKCLSGWGKVYKEGGEFYFSNFHGGGLVVSRLPQYCDALGATKKGANTGVQHIISVKYRLLHKIDIDVLG